MKSYLQGMITGGVLVFAAIVFMGANGHDSKIGRFEIINNFQYSVLNNDYTEEKYNESIILNTESGNIYSITGSYEKGEKILGWNPLNIYSMKDSMGERKVLNNKLYKK